MEKLDPRRHPYRRDRAAHYLKGRVSSETFVQPVQRTVVAPVLDMFGSSARTSLDTQLLAGEHFDIYDIVGALAWGQCQTDGYVGYVELSGLGEVEVPDARVTAIAAHLYPEPNIKTCPSSVLPFAATFCTKEENGEFIKCWAGYIHSSHVNGAPAADFVATAERFLGVPYLWGGRTSFGIDCSALVQSSLASVGSDCPRDSDMQQAELGSELPVSAELQRGDLIFWQGHVGMMQDTTNFIHANAHHMTVASEPITEVVSRIQRAEEKDVLVRKRL